MNTVSNAVAFFDIGNTLASVRVSSTTPPRIEEMRVFPDIPPVLQALRQAGVRLGILSDRGPIAAEDVNAALEQAGLLPFFDASLILYGPKDSVRLFEQAAHIVHESAPEGAPATLLFAGEDAAERAQARAANFLVAPHPSLVLSVLQARGPLRYLRIHIPQHGSTEWRKTLRDLPLAPLHLYVEPTAGAPAVSLYAIGDASTAAQLDDLGFWVDRLGVDDEPATSDLYLLRDDRQEEVGFLQEGGNAVAFFRHPSTARQVLSSTAEGLLVAVPAGRSVESYHFAGAAHGHNLKLTVSLSVLDPIDVESNPRLAATMAAATNLLGAAAAAFAPTLSDAERCALEQSITAQRLECDVARYTGIQPVDGNATILSRHIHHPHNADAIVALANDLTNLGAGRLSVRTHRFTHEGKSYDNVEAILPAAGLDGIVLLSAHMDSTGARQMGYRPWADPAPGADDDASGVAGVLAAVHALLALSATDDKPRRELRFVLFNAEEHGLIGSRAYAREQALLIAPIVAVFQMDMIGYDVNPGRSFELHAGFTPVPVVQERSLLLSELIASLLAQVSPNLSPPQLYPGVGAASDPAERRSDHYSFQVEGYAACLASEDFFIGPGPAAPAPDPNPNYHLPADASINATYAADIARAVTAAAWIAATR